MKIIFSKSFSWKSQPLFLGYKSSPPQLYIFWLFNLCMVVARPKYSRTLWHTITFPFFHPIKQYQHWQRWRHHPLYGKSPVVKKELARWAMNVGWWWRMLWKRIFTKSGVFCYTPELYIFRLFNLCMVVARPKNQLYFFTRKWQVILVKPFRWKGQKRPLGIKRAELAGIAYFFSLAIYWIKRLDRA